MNVVYTDDGGAFMLNRSDSLESAGSITLADDLTEQKEAPSNHARSCRR